MKKIMLFTICAAMVCVMATAVFAGKDGPKGKSNVAHLYLYEKNPNTKGEIVKHGAWGKMMYKLSESTFDYVFNGHGLDAGESYTLVHSPGSLLEVSLICLGSATADEEGNVHIKESVDIGPDGFDGGTIDLLPSDDVDCENQCMVWIPPGEIPR